ncbi:MAG TPA: UDP-N-acetylmuramoyl-L-alanine--D-glutamate ligase, partial [Burkholderiales bacterium]|nr:UDP-N-acetylmuramoyl-L-alanine--D-glutamate ligase [Burkholderiales bacterium]
MLVLGLGDTGLSVARWVTSQGGVPRVADTRARPPRLADYAGELRTGAFDEALLEGVALVCVSPGLALDQPLVREALGRGVPIVGDVELFAWHNRGPVLAVTGTNGKSTVTALAAHLLRSAGLDAQAAGNIGPPVLAAQMAHAASPPAAWVLELSSYQLETTWSLAPAAATVLNLTEDHLDRYACLAHYGQAKARIFRGAALQVVNREDPRARALAEPGAPQVSFGLDAPPCDDAFGLREGMLVRGREAFLRVEHLPIHGRHNVANALAACALAGALGVPSAALAAGLRSFRGLPHRLQRVAQRGGVEWYDDSKGTNVGATVAALEGLGRPAVLILGGEGKGQDFAPLAAPVARHARAALLIGRDAPLLERALQGLPTHRCASL